MSIGLDVDGYLDGPLRFWAHEKNKIKELHMTAYFRVYIFAVTGVNCG
jgi:hypothetical protein